MKNEINDYTEYLFNLALSKCGDLHDAEDLTQDTLLAAYQYIYKGGQISNLKYWLTSTLSHKWNDKLRKKYKLPTVSIDMVSCDTRDDTEPCGPNAEDVRREVAYLAKLLYIISRGIPFENTGFNLMLCEDIPHLVKCGVLGDNNGKVYVNIPILTLAEYELLDGICCRYTEWLTDIVEPWIREIFPKLKIEIPKHLDGRVAEFRRYSCYAIPMTFIKRAVESGNFDAANATPPMVFVVDDRSI